MTSKFDKTGLIGKSLKGDEASNGFKAADLEHLRKNIAKRSLDVKFDLTDTYYKPIENIGIGAYGVVCSAVHKKSGDRVAIKKIPNVFDALIIAKRTYREIKILKHFKHDNIISIREILLPKENAVNFKDIYVVFDLMESDLHRIIYSEQELSEEHIRYFLYQILRGLKYIHSANVIHRDLKPSNLLVNEDCHLRIGDFGMARGLCDMLQEPSYYMTQYVATRWYRAPEILLSMLEYGVAADMWSVGCIFAEMIGRKHLFPGKDYIGQVKLIIGVLGTPTEDVLINCQSEILKKMIKSCAKKEPVGWDKLFPKTSKKSLDLLSKMLVLNPADRITVNQALSHRLLNSYHDPDDEPICVPTFNFDFEKEDMDKSQLRTAIMDEILSFHQPKQPTLSFNACLRPAPKAEEVKDKSDFSELFNTETISLHLTTADDDFKNLSSETEFKRPNSNNLHKPATSKVSPVTVDIGRLQVATSCDIEMLSAQSSDGRVMDTHHQVELEEVKAVQVKTEETAMISLAQDKDVSTSADKKGGSTISEDIKARVKQALMKPRTDSQSEEIKEVKHITAAQRQKEREEKRRKKKERALEKVKKSKEKKGVCVEQTFQLSSQDLELLKRWTVMQQPGQQNDTSPPHPGPAMTPPQTTVVSKSQALDTSSDHTFISQQTLTGNKQRQILAKSSNVASINLGSAAILSTNQFSSNAVLFPSGQIGLVQTTFIPVIAIPSVNNPGKIEIKRILQASDLVPQVSTAGMQASDSTKNLLQNAILMRNQSISLPGLQTVKINTEGGVAQSQNFSPPVVPSESVQYPKEMKKDVADNQLTNLGPLPSATGLSEPKDFLHSNRFNKDDELSPRSQGNDLLEFLDHHLKDSPKPLADQVGVVQDSNSSYVLPCQHDSLLHVTPPPFVNYDVAHNHEEHLQRSSSTPSLLRSHVHSSSDIIQLRPQRSSVPFASYCGDHSTSNSFDNQSNGSLLFPQNVEAPSFQNDFSQHPQSSQVLTYHSTLPVFSASSDFPSLSDQEHTSNQLQPDHLHPQDSNQPVNQFSNHQHQVFDNSSSISEYQSYTATPTPTFDPEFNLFHSSQQQYPPSISQFQISYASSGSPSHSSVHQQNSQIPSSSSTFLPYMDNSHHASTGSKLRINCSQQARPSGSDIDLLAIINKLSRSQVVDSFPPALALTPKGTGAGYGVGMELDSLLIDAQDTASMRPDQSPLSSSLLADWLDISYSMSQADLEALAQEMSPMHITYGDMNL